VKKKILGITEAWGAILGSPFLGRVKYLGSLQTEGAAQGLMTMMWK